MCARKCPKEAIRLVPEAALSGLDIPDNILSQAQIEQIGTR